MEEYVVIYSVEYSEVEHDGYEGHIEYEKFTTEKEMIRYFKEYDIEYNGQRINYVLEAFKIGRPNNGMSNELNSLLGKTK